ncbi:MAG: 30S ribosomal protein S18 [bacterium]|nr:30S ribosomal protein S18 [bacterium]
MDNKKGKKNFRKPLKRRVCRFCVNKVESVDYKDIGTLQRYITERGKIMHRRASKNCARHQRMVSTAIKQARVVALLPYVVT